jgi:hypothetical protein
MVAMSLLLFLNIIKKPIFRLIFAVMLIVQMFLVFLAFFMHGMSSGVVNQLDEDWKLSKIQRFRFDTHIQFSKGSYNSLRECFTENFLETERCFRDYETLDDLADSSVAYYAGSYTHYEVSFFILC